MIDTRAAVNAAHATLSLFKTPHNDPEFYAAKLAARRSVRTILGAGVPFVLRFEGVNDKWLDVGGETVRSP